MQHSYIFKACNIPHLPDPKMSVILKWFTDFNHLVKHKNVLSIRSQSAHFQSVALLLGSMEKRLLAVLQRLFIAGRERFQQAAELAWLLSSLDASSTLHEQAPFRSNNADKQAKLKACTLSLLPISTVHSKEVYWLWQIPAKQSDVWQHCLPLTHSSSKRTMKKHAAQRRCFLCQGLLHITGSFAWLWILHWCSWDCRRRLVSSRTGTALIWSCESENFGDILSAMAAGKRHGNSYLWLHAEMETLSYSWVQSNQWHG